MNTLFRLQALWSEESLSIAFVYSTSHTLPILPEKQLSQDKSQCPIYT